MSDHVLVRREGRVVVVTFNRAQKKNALTHDMYAQAAAALEEAERDEQARAIVITGAGDSFTAGNDLLDFAAGMPAGEPPVVRFLRAISTGDKPLVVAVNGAAVGVGLTMLPHADLSFASESATFKAPFVRLGLAPEAASSLLLPACVGMAMANDILIAGRTLTAPEAFACGLVSRVYAVGRLMPETMRVAHAIADQAPGAVRDTKRLVRADRAAIAERMAAEGAIFMERLKSPEFMEAAAAFIERRPARFD